jgi:hypothetical protein
MMLSVILFLILLYVVPGAKLSRSAWRHSLAPPVISSANQAGEVIGKNKERLFDNLRKACPEPVEGLLHHKLCSLVIHKISHPTAFPACFLRGFLEGRQAIILHL